MESEGPYFHRCGTPGEKSNCTACAYEEGRKSAEKDFKELLEMANELNECYKSEYEGSKDMPVMSQDFEAWKKARGIE